MTRARPAPRAVRTAISRWRPDARASSVLATLAQAMSSTNVTIVSSAMSVPRIPDTTLSRSGRTVMPRPVFDPGYARSSSAAMRGHLGLSLSHADAVLQSPEQSKRSAGPIVAVAPASDSGTHISARVCQNGAKRNPGGMTPTTTYGSPIELDGAADDCRIATEPALPQPVAQHDDPLAAGLVVARRRTCGRASGGTPRRSKRSRRTCSPLTRSGRSPPPSVAPHACAALSRSNERAVPTIVDEVGRRDRPARFRPMQRHDQAIGYA